MPQNVNIKATMQIDSSGAQTIGGAAPVYSKGPATDINIQAREMEKLRAELNEILAKASGQPIEIINRDTDRDFYLNATEAIAYGLADKIVNKI